MRYKRVLQQGAGVRLLHVFMSLQGTGVRQDQGSRLQPHALSGGVSSHTHWPLGG